MQKYMLSKQALSLIKVVNGLKGADSHTPRIAQSVCNQTVRVWVFEDWLSRIQIPIYLYSYEEIFAAKNYFQTFPQTSN